MLLLLIKEALANVLSRYPRGATIRYSFTTLKLLWNTALLLKKLLFVMTRNWKIIWYRHWDRRFATYTCIKINFILNFSTKVKVWIKVRVTRLIFKRSSSRYCESTTAGILTNIVTSCSNFLLKSPFLKLRTVFINQIARITRLTGTQYLHRVLLRFGWLCNKVLHILALSWLGKLNLIIGHKYLIIGQFPIYHHWVRTFLASIRSIISLVECIRHCLLLMWLFLRLKRASL